MATAPRRGSSEAAQGASPTASVTALLRVATGRRAEAVRGRRQVARAADDELTVPMPGKDPVSPKISV